MKTINNLQIKTKVNIPYNMQYYFHKNYILTISNEKNKIDFYEIKKYKKIFSLDKNFSHEKYKYLSTKENKLFLIGYENDYINELSDNNKKNKHLDIYLLKLEQKEIEKVASFQYFKFKEDEIEDKLYIVGDKTIIIYDLNTGTSNKKNSPFNIEFCIYWSELFITDKYMIFIYFNMVTRRVFSFFYDVINKNLDDSKECFFSPYYVYDEDAHYRSARNDCVQISNNYFSIYSEIHNQSRIISFAEIELKEGLKEYETAFTREKEITINELGDMKIYPINEEKCGIVFDYKNYYLCDLSKMEITLKIELNINEKLFLFKFEDDNKDRYKLYLTDENHKKLLYIS